MVAHNPFHQVVILDPESHGDLVHAFETAVFDAVDKEVHGALVGYQRGSYIGSDGIQFHSFFRDLGDIAVRLEAHELRGYGGKAFSVELRNHRVDAHAEVGKLEGFEFLESSHRFFIIARHVTDLVVLGIDAIDRNVDDDLSFGTAAAMAAVLSTIALVRMPLVGILMMRGREI